jgi:hypothetical protein
MDNVKNKNNLGYLKKKNLVYDLSMIFRLQFFLNILFCFISSFFFGLDDQSLIVLLPIFTVAIIIWEAIIHDHKTTNRIYNLIFQIIFRALIVTILFKITGENISIISISFVFMILTYVMSVVSKFINIFEKDRILINFLYSIIPLFLSIWVVTLIVGFMGVVSVLVILGYYIYLFYKTYININRSLHYNYEDLIVIANSCCGIL